jgi:hypothetical protein
MESAKEAKPSSEDSPTSNPISSQRRINVVWILSIIGFSDVAASTYKFVSLE